MQIKINNKTIGENQPTFIIAEAGINHNGSVKIAKKMIEKAKECGADAIKFQTFKAEDLASPKSNFYNTFKKLELDFSDFGELSDHAKNCGLIFCSTPFSNEAVDELNKIKVPFFKIAAGDLTHIPLIQHAASKKKPIIISTGMADINEIKYAIKKIESKQNKKIIVMHSVSSYPTPPKETNLNVIKTMKQKLKYPIGYSDNGPDILVPVTAIILGANIIEKHFTLNQKMSGPDQSFSANPKQLSEIVMKAKEIQEILGDGIKRCMPSEKENRTNARRSITATTNIQKGTKIEANMVGIKRPAKGIEPHFINKVVGKVVSKNIKIHESLRWKDLE